MHRAASGGRQKAPPGLHATTTTAAVATATTITTLEQQSQALPQVTSEHLLNQLPHNAEKSDN